MRWQFRIKNQSAWQTTQLGAIIRAVAKNLPHVTRPRHLDVLVRNTKGRVNCQVTSLFSLTQGKISVKLPAGGFDKKLLCCQIAWCLAYAGGKKPAELRGTAYYDCRVMDTVKDDNGAWTTTGKYKYEVLFAWVDAMPLSQKAGAITATGAGLALQKAATAQDKVFEWQSKVKKATTILKKWQRRLKYYEQRAARLQGEQSNGT